MEFYTIYKSDEMKITIPMVIHKLFELSKVKKKSLNNNQFHLLLSYTLSLIKKKGETFENKEIKSSSEIPVIEKNKPLSLYKPFDIFEQGFGILTCAEDEETLQISIDSIKEIYEEDEQIYFYMFSKPFFGVNGFFSFIGEKEILIAYFSLAEWENIDSE